MKNTCPLLVKSAKLDNTFYLWVWRRGTAEMFYSRTLVSTVITVYIYIDQCLVDWNFSWKPGASQETPESVLFLVLKVLFDIKVYFTQPVFKMSVLTKYFVYNSSGSDVFLQETCYLRTRQSGPHGRSITVIFLSVYRREYLATPHPPTHRSVSQGFVAWPGRGY